MNLEAVKDFSRAILEDDTTGHDWKHALRVEQNARKLCENHFTEDEMAVVLASCWLHDTIDDKLAEEKRQTPITIREKLSDWGASSAQIDEILDTIQHLSYSKNLETKHKLSPLGQVVQDADRLDAIGAIGIARAFYFGGSRGHMLYNDDKPRDVGTLTESSYREESSVLNHFYEKLLLLEETMNTEAGKQEASLRTSFMKKFLDRFYEEIAMGEM